MLARNRSGFVAEIETVACSQRLDRRRRATGGDENLGLDDDMTRQKYALPSLGSLNVRATGSSRSGCTGPPARSGTGRPHIAARQAHSDSGWDAAARRPTRPTAPTTGLVRGTDGPKADLASIAGVLAEMSRDRVAHEGAELIVFMLAPPRRLLRSDSSAATPATSPRHRADRRCR